MDIENELKKLSGQSRPFRDTREDIALDLRLHLNNNTCLRLQSKDLSQGGIGILLSGKEKKYADRLSLGTAVGLEIHLPSLVSIKAKVAWVETAGDGPQLIGLTFVDLPEAIGEQIKTYMLDCIIRRNLDDE